MNGEFYRCFGRRIFVVDRGGVPGQTSISCAIVRSIDQNFQRSLRIDFRTPFRNQAILAGGFDSEDSQVNSTVRPTLPSVGPPTETLDGGSINKCLTLFRRDLQTTRSLTECCNGVSEILFEDSHLYSASLSVESTKLQGNTTKSFLTRNVQNSIVRLSEIFVVSIEETEGKNQAKNSHNDFLPFKKILGTAIRRLSTIFDQLTIGSGLPSKIRQMASKILLALISTMLGR
uniref:Uncharacterized protein n=1 Tax=Romanomermis culicivorax TaxID=13658 RepID=A0A915HML9_ROMCU